MIRGRAGRVVLGLLTAGYLVVLWSLTLRHEPFDDDTAGLIDRLIAVLSSWPPTAWIGYDLVEFCANIALFVPLGVLVPLWARPARWWWSPLAGLVVSGAIETVQLLALPERVADPRDLLSNTLGALLGGVAVALIRSVRAAPAPPGPAAP